MEGLRYPTEISSDYKEANISNPGISIIGPKISELKRVGHKTLLKSGKEKSQQMCRQVA